MKGRKKGHNNGQARWVGDKRVNVFKYSLSNISVEGSETKCITWQNQQFKDQRSSVGGRDCQGRKA